MSEELEDDFEPRKWECEMCWGPVETMGVLGRRCHGKCRNCGAEQSKLLTAEQAESEDDVSDSFRKVREQCLAFMDEESTEAPDVSKLTAFEKKRLRQWLESLIETRSFMKTLSSEDLSRLVGANDAIPV